MSLHGAKRRAVCPAEILLPACVTLLFTACIPIPAKHQEQVTPTVMGTLARDDGTAPSRYFISATDDEKDLTCSSRPGGRGVTDSLGHFQLSETREWKKMLWVTMMENLGRRLYWICARPVELGAPGGARVDVVTRTLISGHFVGDTLGCIQWRWHETSHVSCNIESSGRLMPSRERQIVRGGSWSEGDLNGNYRVLFPQEDWVSREQAVVQWVANSPGATTMIRAQAALPTRDSLVIWGASLEQVDSTWCLRVRSARTTTWGNDIWHTFELGPPGIVREIPEK